MLVRALTVKDFTFRYTRINQTLHIANFTSVDNGTFCCEIEITHISDKATILSDKKCTEVTIEGTTNGKNIIDEIKHIIYCG